MTPSKRISLVFRLPGFARCPLGTLFFLLTSFYAATARGLGDPGLAGDTAFAEWDVFTDASGGGNLPDAGLGGSTGFATLPVLRQTNPDAGAFITSSGSIYSFSGVSHFEIEGYFVGDLNNLVLQFTTLGAEIDYDSIRFSHGPTFDSSFAPVSAAPTATAPGEVTYLAQWDISQLGGVNVPFRITFEASGTSVSLAAARIDLSDTFNDVAPAPPILQNDTDYLAYAGAPVSIQLEATGEPFVYSATGLPSWLSIDNATGLISGNVPAETTGVYSFSVTAFNGQNSEPLALSLHTVVPQNFGDWAVAQALPSSERIPSADTDGDSLTNLEEYFFGTDPLVADASASVHSLAYVREAGQPDRLVLSFNWNLQAADVQVTLETADASFVWTSGAPGAALELFTDGSAEASLITEDSASGFLRLTLSIQT